MKTKYTFLLGVIGVVAGIATYTRAGKNRLGLDMSRLSVQHSGQERVRPTSPTHGIALLEPLMQEIRELQNTIAMLPGCEVPAGLPPGLRGQYIDLYGRFEDALDAAVYNIVGWGQRVNEKERMDRVRYLASKLELVPDQEKRFHFAARLRAAVETWGQAAALQSPRLAYICAMEGRRNSLSSPDVSSMSLSPSPSPRGIESN